MNEDKNIEDKTNAPAETQAETGSPLARLRDIRREFAADTETKLPIPGYRGELLGVYGPLPWEMVRGFAFRAERNKRATDIEVTVAADALANAVRGFIFRDRNTGHESPLTFNGVEVTGYGRELAAALGIEGETVREIVKATFPDPVAVVAHYGELMEWQAEREDKTEADTLSAAKGDDAVHPTSR